MGLLWAAVLAPPARALTAAEIRSGLAEQRYGYLTHTLAVYRTAYEEGVINEVTLNGLLLGFWSLGMEQDAAIDAALDRWVQSSTDAVDPRLARGIYHQSAGWQARGDRVIRDTPPDNLVRMRARFSRARADFTATQDRWARCDPCLSRRINMAKADGAEDPKALFDQALATNPAAHYAPLAYATAIEERWGGRPGERDRFVETFCNARPQASACGPLTARVALDRARVALDRGDSGTAEAEADRAIAADPTEVDAWDVKAWCLTKRGDHQTALRLLNARIALRKAPAWPHVQRAWLHLQAGHPEPALDDYEAAAAQGDADALAQALAMTQHGAHGAGRDPQRGLTLCRQMADRRHSAGALCLGELHYTGVALPRDLAQAAYWYGQAAEQGNAKAMVALGILKWSGNGVPKDARGATRLWRQARDAGEPLAEARLAELGWWDRWWYVTLPDAAQWIMRSVSAR